MEAKIRLRSLVIRSLSVFGATQNHFPVWRLRVKRKLPIV